MSFHAPLSPSSFKANVLCAGRYNFSKDIVEIPKLAALQGTTAHELFEGWLGKALAWDVGDVFVGSNGASIDADNIQHVRETYLWLVDFLKDKPTAVVYSELRVDPGYVYNGIVTSSGTSDIIIYHESTLYVFDYKNGMIDVEVLENYQLLLYALGAYRKFSQTHLITKITVGVLQPRTFHHEGQYRLWDVNLDELLHNWDVKFRNMVPIMMEGTERNPGTEQCRWCKGKPTCKEAAQQALADARATFKPVSANTPEEVKAQVLRHPDELNDIQLRGIMESYEFIMGWLKAVKAHIENRFAHQNPLKGFKMVAGRGTRSWSYPDETKMVKVLCDLTGLDEDDFYKSKFKSPAQVENTIKSLVTPEQWEKVHQQIKKSQGKATLALMSDGRAAVNLSPEEAFKDTTTKLKAPNLDFLD